MAKILFYSGQQCCLCDDAMALLKQAKVHSSQLIIIDVKSDPQTFHLYGARIPVLVNTQNQQELAWPFNLTRLTEFLP